MTLALEMWDWCQERDILVISSHIPGRDNVSADKESREFKDMSEWKLVPTIIKPFLLNRLTDQFASRLTNQLADSLSVGNPTQEPFTQTPLRYTLPLPTGLCLPPFNLISKTLMKVTID